METVYRLTGAFDAVLTAMRMMRIPKINMEFMMPHSISSTAKDLSVSKIKLYKMIKQAGAEPVPFGNRKIIKDADFKKLRQILIDEGRQPELFNTDKETVSSNSKNSADHSQPFAADQSNTYLADLLAEKDKQIERLEKQLDIEKAEKQGLQNGLIQLNGAMLQLDKRISMLQPPEQPEHQEVVVKADFKEAEEAVVVEPETAPLTPKKSGLATPLIWAAAAALLTISAVELGGLSVGNLVRDLLAAR